LKHTTQVKRPSGTNEQSFPSGHTAQAFAAATFMHKELGHHNIWISIGAYAMASSVGVLRVLNDKHWSSDVLTGAGIGILSTNLVYLTHRYKWGKRPGLVLLPTYTSGPGVFVSFKLD
jgi:membrane-associated phospholipid phosphatase